MADDTTTTTSSASGLSAEYSVDTEEFVSQLYISVPVGCILIFLYCIVRYYYLDTWEIRRQYTRPRHRVDDDDENTDDENNNNRSDNESDYYLPNTSKPITHPHISKGFIYWMYDVWNMDTNDFYQHAGFDALVFRLYLKGCLWICLVSLPYALCVLLPVYGTSEVK